MKKKIITLTITACLVFTIFFSFVSSSSAKVNKESILNLKTVVGISFQSNETEEPLTPKGEVREINLNVSFRIEIERFGKNIINLLSNKKATVELGIVDYPLWSTVSIDTQTLEFDISNDVQYGEVILAVSASEEAPAYEIGTVRINASVDPIKGPLGLITLIDGYKKDFTVAFIPDYVGIIDPEPTKGDFYEIAPYNTTTIPINIKNLGNGKTNVIVEIVNSSDSFNLSIPDNVLVDVNENQTVYLALKADHKFDQELIRLKFTPAYSLDLEVTGNPCIVTLMIENDGSYKEPEEEFEIDTTMLTVILLIIILAIIVIIVFLKRK